MLLFQTHTPLRATVKIALIGAGAVGVSLLIDRWWYGEWTVVQLNFLQFNVLTVSVQCVCERERVCVCVSVCVCV